MFQNDEWPVSVSKVPVYKAYLMRKRQKILRGYNLRNLIDINHAMTLNKARYDLKHKATVIINMIASLEITQHQRSSKSSASVHALPDLAIKARYQQLHGLRYREGGGERNVSFNQTVGCITHTHTHTHLPRSFLVGSRGRHFIHSLTL